MTSRIPIALDFDAQELDAFIRRELPDVIGVMHLDRIGGGQSNPTFFVTFGNRRMVLRKKPAGKVLPSAHAIDREYRVMSALAATNVPVPTTILFHADSDVIGTPFYLMDRMDGRVFSDNTLPGMQPQERRAIYFAMAETMAKLHQVDWVGLGLADFGKPGNFFARQLARWSKQWSLSKTQPNPDIDTLIAWLNANLPHDDETALAHGDFKLGNLMFHPIEPRVIAVLDWELSTIGHPLADVAFSAVVWRLFPEEYGGIRGLDLDALGIPREEEYLAHYYHCVSRETPVAPFHYALALMRWAVIFEGISARARIGTAIADNATEVGALSVALARRGVEVIEAVSTT